MILMKQLAIIGSTASGKSDLALSLATAHNAIILSIDSLSIYRDIDIASAKPSKAELGAVLHFGIDRLLPDETASVITFIDEYKRARFFATEHNKNLIIVGGSSFYLKSMLEGLSEIPEFSPETLQRAQMMLQDLPAAHTLLAKIDPHLMEKITQNDRYRIEKMLLIHLETSYPPSEWFESHPPKAIINECPVLEIKVERPLLRERIAQRTRKMIASGLIDEVSELERIYGREPNSMKAIGIIETLEYLDGRITKSELFEQVSTHTAQLAKRQQTFNSNQFDLSATGSAAELAELADSLLS